MNSKASNQCYRQPQADRERKTGFNPSCCRLGVVAGVVPSTYPQTSHASSCGRQRAVENVSGFGAGLQMFDSECRRMFRNWIDVFEHKNWLQLS